MATPPLFWFDTYYFPYKHSHRGHFSHEVALDTILDIIQSKQCTLWDPIYYYYEEQKFPITKEQLDRWFRFQKNCLLVQEFVAQSISDLRGVSQSQVQTIMLGCTSPILNIYRNTIVMYYCSRYLYDFVRCDIYDVAWRYLYIFLDISPIKAYDIRNSVWRMCNPY